MTSWIAFQKIYLKLLKLCWCNTAHFIHAHCGDNSCTLAGQEHTCITPFATTSAGQTIESLELSGNHHACRPRYRRLSIIQWTSHLQAKQKNTCVSSSSCQFGQPRVSSSGHHTCRPSYRHLWILQWPPHLQARAQRWSHARIAAVRVMLCTWALHPHLETKQSIISWYSIRLTIYFLFFPFPPPVPPTCPCGLPWSSLLGMAEV